MHPELSVRFNQLIRELTDAESAACQEACVTAVHASMDRRRRRRVVTRVLQKSVRRDPSFRALRGTPWPRAGTCTRASLTHGRLGCSYSYAKAFLGAAAASDGIHLGLASAYLEECHILKSWTLEF